MYRNALDLLKLRSMGALLGTLESLGKTDVGRYSAEQNLVIGKIDAP
jgi:hypothetical protein